MVEQVLGGKHGIDVDEDAIGGLALAGVAGHDIAVIEVRIPSGVDAESAPVIRAGKASLSLTESSTAIAIWLIDCTSQSASWSSSGECEDRIPITRQPARFPALIRRPRLRSRHNRLVFWKAAPLPGDNPPG